MRIKEKLLLRKQLFEPFHESTIALGALTFDIKEDIVLNLEDHLTLFEQWIAVNKIDEETVLKVGLAQESTKHMKHLGHYVVYPNLSAYVKPFTTLDRKYYVLVYGMGEVQQGRTILYVSGIWEVEY